MSTDDGLEDHLITDDLDAIAEAAQSAIGTLELGDFPVGEKIIVAIGTHGDAPHVALVPFEQAFELMPHLTDRLKPYQTVHAVVPIAVVGGTTSRIDELRIPPSLRAVH